MKKGNQRKRNKLYTVVIVLCVIVFAGSGAVLLGGLWDYYQAAKTQDGLVDQLEQPPTEEDLAAAPKGINPDFAGLYRINPDFIGWLKIPDTRIDYPVVHCSDNDTYLKTDFYGAEHKLGTVFLDSRAKFGQEGTSSHLVLYGHSAKDGSFFANVRNYKKLDYYQQHPVIQFDTLYEQANWIIVSAYLIDAQDTTETAFWYHDMIDFTDEKMYNDFVSQITKRNYYQNDIDLQYGDTFLTLSTCDYDINDSRFVVTARKLRADETVDSFQPAGFSRNPDPYMPTKWKNNR